MKRAAIALAAFAVACVSPSEPVVPIAAELTAFTLEAARNPALSADVPGVIVGDTVLLVIPEVMPVDALVPTFVTREAVTTVEVDAFHQTSGTSVVDLRADRRYRLRSSTGAEREYVVRTVVFTGLPVIRITTADGLPVDSRDTYKAASIDVYGGKDHPEWSFVATTQIRGRGNSTWEMPKKPYRLKLTTSRTVFGFPADRDWTLLANYWDATLARNAVAFQLSSTLGMAFTPRCTPAEVFLNGAHQGSYQLCDHVEVATNRVPAGANGWFLELNGHNRIEPGEVWFETPRITEYTTVGQGDTIPSVWVFKQPDPPSVAQRDTVRAQLLAFEEALYGPAFASPDSGYAAHLDVQAIIDWFLVNELSKNNDAAFTYGVLAFRPAGGRITFGPVWDFDLAFGNYPWDFAPEGWKIKNAGYLPRLFADPAFVAQVKARWQVLRAQRGAIDQFIVDYAARMQRSQARSHLLWDPYLPRPTLVVDFDAEVQALRSWLSTRFDWLDAQFNAL